MQRYYQKEKKNSRKTCLINRELQYEWGFIADSANPLLWGKTHVNEKAKQRRVSDWVL